MKWKTGLIVMLALGATLGTALDAIHSHFGATEYTDPVMFKAAWWVPLLFAGAFAIGLLRPALDRTPARWWQGPLAMAFFTAAYFASVLPTDMAVTTAIVGGIFVVSWLVCDRSLVGLAISLGGAIGGPLVETALVRAGLFRHTQVSFLAVPAWLPVLYMAAGVGLGMTAKTIVVGTSGRVRAPASR